MVITQNSNNNPSYLFGTISNSIYVGSSPLYGFPSIVNQIIIPKPNVNQALGLVKINPCNDPECRVYPEKTYINPVLAELTSNNAASAPDRYKNDSNTFLIEFASYYTNVYETLLTLESQIDINEIWTYKNTLYQANTTPPYIDNSFGRCIAYNTLPNHPDYCGYIINWNDVLSIYGEGIYRLKFTIIAKNGNGYCGISEPFCLKTYSCTNASNTVKFEITLNGGLIGDCDAPDILWNICGLTYSDSIRFEGFFNYEKDEYERKDVKYNNGIIYHVRDETIKKFELMTGRLPYWLHSRFRAYALMAGGNTNTANNDNLLVSDYNFNNPNYNINRKGVIPDSGYEPIWVQNSRYARVKVSFKEDQQNLIRRKCCTT